MSVVDHMTLSYTIVGKHNYIIRNFRCMNYNDYYEKSTYKQ